MDWLQRDRSCLWLLTHLHLDVGWGCSHAKAQLYVPDGLCTGRVADAGYELHWSYGQAPTYNFTTWRGLLTAWWSANSLASHLTAGFLEPAALPPVHLSEQPQSLPRVRGVERGSPSWWGCGRVARQGGTNGRDCNSRLRERQSATAVNLF